MLSRWSKKVEREYLAGGVHWLGQRGQGVISVGCRECWCCCPSCPGRSLKLGGTQPNIPTIPPLPSLVLCTAKLAVNLKLGSWKVCSIILVRNEQILQCTERTGEGIPLLPSSENLPKNENLPRHSNNAKQVDICCSTVRWICSDTHYSRSIDVNRRCRALPYE